MNKINSNLRPQARKDFIAAVTQRANLSACPNPPAGSKPWRPSGSRAMWC